MTVFKVPRSIATNMGLTRGRKRGVFLYKVLKMAVSRQSQERYRRLIPRTALFTNVGDGIYPGPDLFSKALQFKN